jgi:O-acetyl-ADP-ribose deacetylase (regulator of RNase III)
MFNLFNTEKPLKYIEGDATKPELQNLNNKPLIIHCCNNIGAWGAGFVLALSRKDKNPEQAYKDWAKIDTRYTVDEFEYSTGKFELGEVGFALFADINDENSHPQTHVANMIGQHGVGRDKEGNPPVRYESIRKCLKKVRKYCLKNGFEVHAPRFGSDLAGGDWDVIEGLIKDELTSKGIPVTIYDWKG